MYFVLTNVVITVMSFLFNNMTVIYNMCVIVIQLLWEITTNYVGNSVSLVFAGFSYFVCEHGIIML